MSKCECKECLHESVCRIREFPSIEEILKDGCQHYKSKSLFVELPCKCKDCKHWCENYKDDILGIRYGRCKNYKSPYRYEEDNVTENDYCSYGERKLEVGE